MKTENNLENKKKFFAQYWGQEIVKWNFSAGGHSSMRLTVDDIRLNTPNESDFFLELTPLSQITDEDLIELIEIPEGWEIFKIYKYKSDGYSGVKIRKPYDENELKFNEDGFKYDIKTISLNHKNYDILRSKGYALPWMDLSVEDLVEYGWVKLKD